MEYVGTARAAELLGVKRDTVSGWCREGVFPGAEQDDKGKPWRIPMRDIEAVLKTRQRLRK